MKSAGPEPADRTKGAHGLRCIDLLDTEVILGFNFIKYDEYITKIRMCRNDLTSEKLKKEIDELMHSNSKIPGHIVWPQICLERAMAGTSMPWEEASV